MEGRIRSSFDRVKNWLVAVDRAVCADLTGIEPASGGQASPEGQWQRIGCVLMDRSNPKSAQADSGKSVAFWSVY